MIAVSNGWVNAHQGTLLPETFVEITYAATEPGLQEEATASSYQEESFSETEQVVRAVDKDSEKYATLEHGIWGLDGSYEYYDGSPVDPGYVGNVLSGEDGAFSDVIPTITISFPTLHTDPIPGLTITWSDVFNEWATEFRVTAYGSTQVAKTTVVDNASPHTTLWLEMQDYNRITIEILKWSHPYHRARCVGVFLGIRTVYTKADLMGFTHTQTADLLSASLPKNEITFRLRNEDSRWNPDNPTGAEQYLLTRQEVVVRYGMTVDGATEWIKGGTFWLSGWNTPSNGLEASFTARDALEFMNDEYAGPKSGTLYDIAVAAFEQADLPIQSDGSVRYVVHSSLRNYETDFSGDDTQTHTVAQILQMVAHAGNCVFWQDRDGYVHVEPWEGNYNGYMIDQSISYTHPEYTISKPLKAISVGYGDGLRAEVQVSDKGETQTVDNITLNTVSDAMRVGNRAKEILENRKVISGEFRADVRLDALDSVIVVSKYATNVIAITDLTYDTTGGAFRGTYSGRVVSISLKPEDRRAGEFYLGEV